MSIMERIQFEPPPSNTFFVYPPQEDNTRDNNTIDPFAERDSHNSCRPPSHVLRVIDSESPSRARSESDVVTTANRNTLSPPPIDSPPYNTDQPHRRSYSLTPEPIRRESEKDGEDSQPTVQINGLLSPQRVRPKMKRRETVDTSTINREDHEDYSIVNQYKVVDIIGHGSYGIVHKATDSHNGKAYAMKIVGKRKIMKKKFPFRRPGGKPAPDPLADLRKEIAILKKLSHPNIVKLVEVLEDSNEDDLVLVFDYVNNGPVMDDITVDNIIPEDEARDYFVDLILGLEYLHFCKVIHRDIKPENLLLDETNKLKIADFGVSEYWTSDESDASLHKSAGTPAFTAPETLDKNNTVFGGKGLDIWAAGVTLYCMVYGRVPFTGRSIPELHEKISTQPLKFHEDVSISDDLIDLLSRLLDKDPHKRITIPDIRQHKWFTNSNRPIPSKEDNCKGDILLTDKDIAEAVKEYQTPIHILVMIKTMAKKKSLHNPYGIKDSPSVSPCVSPCQHRKTSPQHSQMERQRMFASMKSIPTISISSEKEPTTSTNDN